jgi:hypothetical protein
MLDRGVYMQETMSNDYEKVPKGSNSKLRSWYLKQLKNNNKKFFKPNFSHTEILRDEYQKEEGMKL